MIRRTAGYTLVELLVAASIMAIAMIYIMGSFTTQRDTYEVVDQVSETQQNTRAIAGLIERDLRSAGYMVPAEAAACGWDSTTGPDTLFVSDWNAIAPADQLSSSLHAQQLAIERTSWPLTALVTGSDVPLVIADFLIDEIPTYPATNSDFQVGGGAIVVDVANPERGCAAGIVLSLITTAPIGLRLNMPNGLGSGIANLPDIRVVPAIVYRVTTPAGSTVPELQRNGVTFARNVEDLQLAWFYDDDEDGQVDGGEYRGAAASTYDASTVDGEKLREVRFNLVVRTGEDDPRNPSSAGRGQARENRLDSSVPGDDGRRRRVHTSTIRLRNVRST